MSALDDLITEHSSLTRELVQQLRELGDMQNRVLNDQASAWHASSHLAVTERRETVKYTTAGLEAEVQVQLAEVQALRAMIANIELRIRYTAEVTRGRA